jgi:hypothetical protein
MLTKHLGCTILVTWLAIASSVACYASERKPDSGQNMGTITYANKTIRRTGISFPYLTHFRDPKILARVNALIDKRTRDFGCDASCKTGYFRVRSKVTYADGDVFSIYASASYDCCGPYPTNDSNISQSYDLRSGELVKFENLFDNYDKNKEEILKIIFASRIARAEKVQSSGKSADTDCDSLYALDNLGDSQFSYNLSKDYLQVQPDWPHAVEACSEIVSVPYSKLRKFQRPNGLLSRIGR